MVEIKRPASRSRVVSSGVSVILALMVLCGAVRARSAVPPSSLGATGTRTGMATRPAVRSALAVLRTPALSLGYSADRLAGLELVSLRSGHPRVGDWDLSSLMAPLTGWQRRQCFAIRSRSGGGVTVAAFSPEGLAYGLSELEVRLRAVGEEGSGLWWGLPPEGRLFEAPAIEERGEYLNIGYDIPPITPHTWAADRWRAYIDKLALARLNRLYLFLWGSDVTAWPASELARSETSLRLYRELPRAIGYAHERGLEVTLMLGPTMIPRDVWKAHPEWHADIDYVKSGFPVVCPNVPEAWKAVQAALRCQLEKLREVDAVQIWFYDPGGCWCEARRCRQDQAASLVRQAKAFAGIYRELNRHGHIEVNLWPISLWETSMKARIREPLAEGLRKAFPRDWRSITIVGTPEEGPTPTPLQEKALGFRTSLFLFAANPESGYSFLTPHLRYMPWAARVARDFGVNACFGHRLEAWTRYPATFLMGQWLWNPDMAVEHAVQRLSGWLTGREDASRELAQAIVLLDRFTDDGAAPDRSEGMGAALRRAWDLAAPGIKPDMEYLPAMFEALAVIGESARAGPDALALHQARFTAALRSSPTFAHLAADGPGTFKRYRELLLPGWRKLMF